MDTFQGANLVWISSSFKVLCWTVVVVNCWRHSDQKFSSDPIEWLECNVDFCTCKLASAELIPRCSIYKPWHLRLSESWVYARRNQTLWTIRRLLKLVIESRNSLKFCGGLRSIKEENEAPKNGIIVSRAKWRTINTIRRSRSLNRPMLTEHAT